MSILRLDIKGNPKSIPYKTLIQVQQNSLSILQDLDLYYSGRRQGALEWFVNDLSRNGSLRVEVYSRVRELKRNRVNDVSSEVTGSFVEGFRTLEKKGESPAYLTENGMAKADKMTHLIGRNGTQAIVATVPEKHKEVEITTQSAKNIEKLIPDAARSLGAVEGKLEVISIHRFNRLIVYEARTGKAVSCFYGKLPLLEKAKAALGRRVMVSGGLVRNAKGEPSKITLFKPDDFKVFGSPELPIRSLSEIGGSDSDFTGGLSTEDFIRSIR